MKFKAYIFLGVILAVITIACQDRTNYKQDLLSNDKNKIIKASYELGERRDSTAVKNLLRKALDPRITHHYKFYGMTVNYSRLIALQKISNNAYKAKIRHLKVDTIATLFFQDWAIKNEYIKTEIDINYK